MWVFFFIKIANLTTRVPYPVAGMEPKNLHFQPVLWRCWYGWSRDHASTALAYRIKFQDNPWPSPACFSSSVSFHSPHWHFNHLLIFSSRQTSVSCGCHIPCLLPAICFLTLSAFKSLLQHHGLSEVSSEVFICPPPSAFHYFSIFIYPSIPT